MKSNQQQLQKRGWANQQELQNYQDLEDKDYLQMLLSDEAYKRTIGATLIKELTSETVEQLLLSLSKEKSLYTKLAICEKLESGDQQTASQMMNYLGKIGNNQHCSLPCAPSKKKCYPLARDIIARSLGRMKPQVMETMIQTMDLLPNEQLSELIDSIGYMSFYHSEIATEENCQKMLDLLEKSSNKKVIQWKILTCLSAFACNASQEKLAEYSVRKDLLGQEAQRSLKLLEMRTA